MEKYIEMCKNKSDLYDIWKHFLGRQTNLVEKLNVLILNSPCHGFGDVVFAMKLSTILKKWYNCSVRIATVQPANFISLGEKEENLIELRARTKEIQCRRFATLKMYRNNKRISVPVFDLIFVAPLVELEPKLSDIKKLIPYANKFNTFFLSEYNDDSGKKFDFNTGIGRKRFGLLLTDIVPGAKPAIKNPYSIVYVLRIGPRLGTCINSFVEMIGKKYCIDDFEIIFPPWIVEEKKIVNRITATLGNFYSRIIVKSKDGADAVFLGKKLNSFTAYIRADILPVPNRDMISLISYSVPDILLTGDQSITDALACCNNKNIFYQINPWKENFARNLEREMPNKWLHKKSESCGGLKSINYKSNYRGLKLKWDFRILAKPKMDGIFYFAAEKKYGKLSREFSLYEKIVLSSRTLEGFKHSWGKIK